MKREGIEKAAAIYTAQAEDSDLQKLETLNRRLSMAQNG